MVLELETHEATSFRGFVGVWLTAPLVEDDDDALCFFDTNDALFWEL